MLFFFFMLQTNQTIQNPAPQLLRPHLQSVAIIYNPASGAGRGKLAADLAAEACEKSGLKVALRQTERRYEGSALEDFMSQADVVLAAVGDGSASALLPALEKTGKPFYMLPSGNESIFAVHFGMRPEADSVIKALSAWQVQPHYYGLAGERPFFCMASVGVDSRVVAATHEKRNGPIGHVGYIGSAIQIAFSYTTPTIRLTVDGRRELEGDAGYLIIANIPDYALRMKLVPEASSEKSVLSARFFPGHGRAGTAKWFWDALFDKQPDLSGSTLFQGKEFKLEILNDEEFPVQADGDPVGFAPLTVRASEGPVNILLPAK